MTRIHQVHGIECTYPENWQLTEDRQDDRLASFTLQSPNTAFMSVYISVDGGRSQELIEEMTALISSEYEEVETTPLDEETLGLTQRVNALQAVDLNFYYLDLLVTARLIAFEGSAHSILIQCQAEDREFDSVEMIYRAMMVSIIRQLK